jgi:predicted Zn-dependent peptidase
MYDYALETLPNGLRVQTIRLPQVHAAVLGCFVRVGPRHEMEEEAGLSHFVEHMLFKGTSSYPDSRALSAALEDIGGEFNGFTQTEYTGFVVRVHRDHVARGIAIFSELFRCPRFRAEDVEHEKRIIEQEIGSLGGPHQRYSLDEFLWPGLRERGVLVGTPERIRAMTRDAAAGFFSRHYRPRNMVLTVAGAFDPAEACAAAAAGFGPLEDAPVPPPPPIDAPAAGPLCAHDPFPAPQGGACVAWLTPSYLHPDLTPILVIDAILGLGTSSRLFTRIREQRGLAYDISANTVLYSDRGMLCVAFGSDARRLPEGVRAVIEETDRLRDEGVAEGELHRIMERVRCEMEYKLDEPDEMAAWFGAQTLLLPPESIRRPEDELRRIRQVGEADLRRVLRSVFVPARRYIVTSGPVPWGARRKISRLSAVE